MSTSRPVLLYDGDCAVCTRLAGFVDRRLRPRATVAPYQEADLAPMGLTPQRCDQALQWVDATGRTSSAQNAVARLLLASRPWARPIGAVLLLPGANWLAGLAYRWVAANRSRLPGGTATCQLPSAASEGG